MKKTKPYVFAILILVAAMLMGVAMFTVFEGERRLCVAVGTSDECGARLCSTAGKRDEYGAQLCSAAGVYDLLSPRIIEIYEVEIAGESVVSDMSAATLARTAERLGISVEKLKAVLLLKDFVARVGRNVSLGELAAMNDFKLLSLFKQCAEEYLSTQPEGRRQELERLLKDALKG